MALVSSTVYKAQMADVATALTTIVQDDTASTKVAEAIQHPLHPLRRFMKFLNYNKTTATFTSNDALVDNVYLGFNTSRGTQDTMQVFNQPLASPLSITTADVEDASPTVINLVASAVVKSADGMVVTVDGLAVSIASFTPTGVGFDINLRTSIANGETVIVAFADVEDVNLQKIRVVDQAVTNNVT